MSHKHNLATHQICIFFSNTRNPNRFTKDRQLGTQGLVNSALQAN
jgi:hypothetical protein